MIKEKYIQKQRWYGGKSNKLKYIELNDSFRIPKNKEVYYHHYFLPIAFVSNNSIEPENKILEIELEGKNGFILDTIYKESFRKVVYEQICEALPLVKTPVQYHKSLNFRYPLYESFKFLNLEQTNTSIIYDDHFILKFFRRIYADKNPDYEMNRYLSYKKEFKYTSKYLGSINIVDSENTNITINFMQKLISNNGEAWQYFLKEKEVLFEDGELLYEYFISGFLETYRDLTQESNLSIGYSNERVYLLKYCLLEKQFMN